MDEHVLRGNNIVATEESLQQNKLVLPIQVQHNQIFIFQSELLVWNALVDSVDVGDGERRQHKMRSYEYEEEHKDEYCLKGDAYGQPKDNGGCVLWQCHQYLCYAEAQHNKSGQHQ